MGQIQNAISGAVSTIVGSQVAGELKTQREITQVSKDVSTVAEQVEGYHKKYDEEARKSNDEYGNLFVDEKGKERMPSNEELAAYREKTQKAINTLNAEYDQIMGWKGRVQKRLDALRARGASSLDLEVAIKQANQRMTEANPTNIGGNR